LRLRSIRIPRAHRDQIGVGFRRHKILTMRKRIGIITVKIFFVSMTQMEIITNFLEFCVFRSTFLTLCTEDFSPTPLLVTICS
ncbi:MAG: hypothetical protein J6X72_06410, partial [Clostridia bacterium]|nr:hypothetical protein [Clostridia bacterium]